MKNMETPTKSLEYAYPTSDNAKKFGHHDKGCWFVVIRGAESETIAGEKAFNSKAEAVEAFNAIEAKVYKWSHAALPAYRFDDAYQTVYEYSGEQGSFVYLSSYNKSGIDSQWSEERKVQQMETNFFEWHFGKNRCGGYTDQSITQ